MRCVKYFLLSVLLILIPMAVLAGNLDDPGAPTTAGGGAMNTLEDIYNLINDGTTNAPRTGTFAEPSAGPSSTGHTLTEVYNRAKTSSRPAKTGQTTLYRTHDDGDLEKGVAWPAPPSSGPGRFTDNDDGTITDNLTGLIWLKNADCAGATKDWNTAIDYSAALYDGCTSCFGTSGDCGLSDGSTAGEWRLPNVRELFSLGDFAYYTPALSNAAGTGQWVDGDAFTDVKSDYYWSSTTIASTNTQAWYVQVGNGRANTGVKTNLYYVWPVRGGQ